MFPSPYFAQRYFPTAYWPKTGTLTVEGAPSLSFANPNRVTVFQCERRGAVFERVADLTVFASNARGLVFEVPPRGIVFFVEEP